MKQLLDLRFIIGAFFFLVGILLFLGSFLLAPGPGKTETVNFLSGILYMIFGLVLLALWRFHRPQGD